MSIQGTKGAEPTATQIAQEIAKPTDEKGHQGLGPETHGAVDMLFNVDLRWDEEEGETDPMQEDAEQQGRHLIHRKKQVTEEARQDGPQKEGAEFKPT